MMENITCDECGKDSGIEKSKSKGTDGANVHNLGWIFKIPMGIGIPESWLICSKECYDSLRERKYREYNVTQVSIDENAAACEKFRDKIPQYAEDTCRKMSALQNLLNQIVKNG